MKALLTLLLSLLTLTTFAAAPIKTKAERSTISGTDQPIVVVSWQAVQTFEKPAQSWEIQRKLFPYGWRDVGRAAQGSPVWFDRKPPKRSAWYRVRVIWEDSKSDWSNKAYVDKVK